MDVRRLRGDEREVDVVVDGDEPLDRAGVAISALDEAVMRRVVPRKFFYNLAITGIKPE